jgi:FKBP-type peptidyl-prolyl cis-trans isomerase FklB
MRQWVVLACAILFFSGSVCAAQDAAPKTQKDKVSYIIGTIVARDMQSQGVDLKADLFMKGFRDVLSGAKPAISDQDAQETMRTFKNEMTAKQQATIKRVAEENKKQEEAFLRENKKKAGVHTLESGLQYKVIKEGSGNKPTLYDKVTVNYRGTLIDGREFDSSYKRNQPATFPVNGVIPGWTEALPLMKTGSVWQLFIPSKLAYGEAGAGDGVIPPNAMLTFEVELLSIGEAAPSPGGAAGSAPGPADKGGKKQ